MSDSITLIAVGDLQLGDSPTTVGYGFYSRYRGRPIDELLGDMRDQLSGADILFGNLETTLVPPPDGETRRDILQLRGEPAFATALARAGFTVLNVANNHAVQHGDSTFFRTVETVRAAGIACCGVRGTPPWNSEPALLLSGRVGVLGYCLRPRQYGSAVPPYAEGNVDQICADVARLRATGAITVVSLHWGEEFVPEPSRAEVEMGRRIIDAGAQLILGHHPHVTRPVELYGSAAIAYSLGNFIGDMIWYEPFRTGLLLRCTVDERGTRALSTVTTHLRDDYRPYPDPGAPGGPVPAGEIRGLDSSTYVRAITDSMRRQRIAAYRAAIVNLPKTPLPILTQLATRTVRNKLSAVLSRVSGGSRGDAG